MLLVPCSKPAPICGWEGKRTQRHLHLKMKKERKTFIVGNKLQKSQCLSANANANHVLVFANLSLTRPHCNNWTGPVLDKRCVCLEKMMRTTWTTSKSRTALSVAAASNDGLQVEYKASTRLHRFNWLIRKG